MNYRNSCIRSLAKVSIAVATILSLGTLAESFLVLKSALALPGQTDTQVADWIRANPALRPAVGERLLVKKSDTAARRFEFLASVLLPGKATIPGNGNIIRSEQIQFFDIINGVTRRRLEEALRSIYGVEIMRDYVTAKTIYSYPTAGMIERAQLPNSRPLIVALQGELREGEQFGYWIETVENETGRANSGRITIFERQSLPKLEAELRKRELVVP